MGKGRWGREEKEAEEEAAGGGGASLVLRFLNRVTEAGNELKTCSKSLSRVCLCWTWMTPKSESAFKIKTHFC
jgi:hypothetical protein